MGIFGSHFLPGAVASSYTLDAPESKGISVQLEVGEDYAILGLCNRVGQELRTDLLRV